VVQHLCTQSSTLAVLVTTVAVAASAAAGGVQVGVCPQFDMLWGELTRCMHTIADNAAFLLLLLLLVVVRLACVPSLTCCGVS
jgi:hypothetical protein